MKYNNPSPLSWLYNKLLCTPDITIFEATEALEIANNMNNEETIYFLTFLREECTSVDGGWCYLNKGSDKVFTDLGIYNLWYNIKR